LRRARRGLGAGRRASRICVSAMSAGELAPQSTRTLLAYGSLALPLSLAEIPIILYLPAFYAQELHLSAGLVGIVFLLARFWDGLSDILIGWLSDRSMSRFGRRKPWIVAGAPFLMLSTWFLCNPPQTAGLGYLVLWAALFYTSFTGVKIPHLSWGTELATDYVERSRVTTFRESFTMLGNLLFVSAPLIFLAEDAPLHDVLTLLALSVLWMTPATALPIALLVGDPASTHCVEAPLFRGLMAVGKDRVLIRFAITRLFFAMEESVTNSLLVFSIATGLNLPNKLFWLIFILYVSTIGTLPLMMRITQRAEKHLLLAGGLTVYGIAIGAFLLIPTASFAWAGAVEVLIGVTNAVTLILPTSILADIIDLDEVTTAERRSGVYVAVDNLVYKLGLALGVGLAFGLLALVHFNPGAHEHSLADARNIRFLGFALPGLLLVPSVVLLLKHPITKAVQRRLRETIDLRDRPTSSVMERPVAYDV
jgi:glycoside/pentoside/hexuronide:cation symporter, GPH family